MQAVGVLVVVLSCIDVAVVSDLEPELELGTDADAALEGVVVALVMDVEVLMSGGGINGVPKLKFVKF